DLLADLGDHDVPDVAALRAQGFYVGTNSCGHGLASIPACAGPGGTCTNRTYEPGGGRRSGDLRERAVSRGEVLGRRQAVRARDPGVPSAPAGVEGARSRAVVSGEAA